MSIPLTRFLCMRVPARTDQVDVGKETDPLRIDIKELREVRCERVEERARKR